jgi:hypothetical protein
MAKVERDGRKASASRLPVCKSARDRLGEGLGKVARGRHPGQAVTRREEHFLRNGALSPRDRDVCRLTLCGLSKYCSAKCSSIQTVN